MSKRRVFGMVTTTSSAEFTVEAIASFFRSTPFTPTDSFFLIDNDQTFDQATLPEMGRVELLVNKTPLGFAENVNQILRIAKDTGADLYFLNNDLIFTDAWIKPLLTDDPLILSPLSNREVQYASSVIVPSTGHVSSVFTTDMVMSLQQYRENRRQVDAIAESHRKGSGGEMEVFVLPFFCVKIPNAILTTLGQFDVSFGKGGGEDYDYCLRAYLAGFGVRYRLQSWIIHFYGKSTWDGGEAVQSSGESERIVKFKQRFREKWGDDLFELVLHEKTSILDKIGMKGAPLKDVITALLGNRQIPICIG